MSTPIRMLVPRRVALLVGLALVASAVPCRAASHTAQILSDDGLPVMGAAILIEGLTGQGRKDDLLDQAVTAQAMTSLTTELLKDVTHERRPNGAGFKSFPSGHTSAAFCLATVMAHEDPDVSWLWYGGAGAIGWSRIDLRAHYFHDVVAGALIGAFFANTTIRWHQDGDALLFDFFRRSW